MKNTTKKEDFYLKPISFADKVLLILKSKYGLAEANVKWDGCVNLIVAEQEIHICNVDLMISILNEIKQYGKDYFGDKWGK